MISRLFTLIKLIGCMVGVVYALYVVGWIVSRVIVVIK